MDGPSFKEIVAKLGEIYKDIDHNVTRIYGRRPLHLAIDLAFHSVGRFQFKGRVIKRGWVEVAIIGDTRTGKTEAVEKIIEHYRAGEMVSGENITYAGLVGGLQQNAKLWSITWGKLPLNDGRLVAIDEASGIDPRVIAAMSDVRSSGVAEVVKIQTERTSSRVRLIWASNPRKSKSMGMYNYGVECVQEVMGRPEDVARLDFAVGTRTGDVPYDVMSRTGVNTKHVVTPDLCSTLVRWAWTRTIDDVEITEEAEDRCIELGKSLSDMYSAVIPLVQPAEQYIKLARLSVALAARLYSSPDGKKLIVFPAHVEYIDKFLRECYDSEALGYDQYSKTQQMASTVNNKSTVLDVLANHKGITELFLDHQEVTRSDIEDFTGKTSKEAREILSFLVRSRCLKHRGSVYYKTPGFVSLLKSRGSQVSKEVEEGLLL